MAEDLLDTIGQLFGPVRGGLAYAVIFVGALLAATTGVVAASVISMGLISLPIMLRYGYDRRFAAGSIAASGTLAQIIPPSLVLIVMADQLGRSVGDMYAGAFIPGIVLAGLYAGYIVADFLHQAELGAGAAAGGAHDARTGRLSGNAVAAGAVRAVGGCGYRLVAPVLQPAAPADADRRAPGDLRVGGHGGRLRRGRDQQAAEDGAAVAAGRAGDVRADPAAGADLPGAGHHLPRRGHAHRGRRHGRDRCADHGGRSPAADLEAAPPGAWTPPPS